MGTQIIQILKDKLEYKSLQNVAIYLKKKHIFSCRLFFPTSFS